MRKQILFARIGWGNNYSGEDLTGHFSEPNSSGSWWERFNFMPGPDDRCYGYVPPMGPYSSPPNPKVKHGWLTVLCSKPNQKALLRPVGWYEDATFESGLQTRPKHVSLKPSLQHFWKTSKYSLTAKAADSYLIPVENRERFPVIPTVTFRRPYLYARFVDEEHTIHDPYPGLSKIAERISALKRRAETVNGSSLNSLLARAQGTAQLEGEFDPTDDTDARERIAASIVRRRGQPEFRQQLLKAYGGRCAISDCDCVDALEAAHIRRYGRGEDTNHVQNGLLLRSDLHTLFDLGKITVDPRDYKIMIGKELMNTVYGKLHGKKLRLPKNPAHWPNKDVLNERRRT
jgi:hypothetical protein